MRHLLVQKQSHTTSNTKNMLYISTQTMTKLWLWQLLCYLVSKLCFLYTFCFTNISGYFSNLSQTCLFYPDPVINSGWNWGESVFTLCNKEFNYLKTLLLPAGSHHPYHCIFTIFYIYSLLCTFSLIIVVWLFYVVTQLDMCWLQCFWYFTYLF